MSSGENMKKDFLKYYIIGLFVICLVCTSLVLFKQNNTLDEASDTKFHDEYTSYNSKETSNGKIYPEVTNEKNYQEEGMLRGLFDDTFLLDYLALCTLNKDAYDVKNVKEKVINQVIQRIIDLNSTLSEDEIKDLFDNGTGVLYLGFPTCPWCRNIVSVLNEAGKDYGIAKINYYNIKEIRSNYSFDDANKLVKNDGSTLYTYLLEKLDQYNYE